MNNIKILTSIEKTLQKAKGATFDERVEIFNKVGEMLSDLIALPHPVTRVKLVPIDKVQGNDYNPNRVAPPEMKLLELSIKKDGFTMPVVVANDDETGGFVVVDGFHRTTVVKKSKEISESLNGYLPVVPLNKNIEDRITSTVRHNIARGSHQVELTAKLVTVLKKHNWTNERIGRELGMDPDEVLRLKQITGLAEAFADKEFSDSWD